jgi:hypothetical protein
VQSIIRFCTSSAENVTLFHEIIGETGASTIIEQGGFPIKHNADGSVAITAKPTYI